MINLQQYNNIKSHKTIKHISSTRNLWRHFLPARGLCGGVFATPWLRYKKANIQQLNKHKNPTKPIELRFCISSQAFRLVQKKLLKKLNPTQ